MSSTSTTPPLPPPPSASKSTTTKSVPKSTNVFSNDGSFLERFQRNKKEEEEKKKEQEALLRKREFDNRFKNRRKRPIPEETLADTTTADEDHINKKAKPDKPLSEYEKQVQSYSGQGLKDNGIGVRPLVK